MTITRVIRDGVEFFTIDETGESGMSDTALARLCGVHRSSVSNLIASSYAIWVEERRLEPNCKRYLATRPEKINNRIPGQTSNIKVLSAPICGEVIRHYALESKHRTKEAIFTLNKFAGLGITAWIQQITEWHGNPIPKSGIVTDFKSIDALLDKRLDGTSYRVYFVLQKAIRLRMTLTAEEVMQRADISRSSYNTAIQKLADLNLLPDWCKITHRQQPEKIVRDRLQMQLGGRVEAPSPWGPIDLLTDHQLIEIKIIHRWKEALGHLLPKSEAYPTHAKRLHLFGTQPKNLDRITDYCTKQGIEVSFELIPKTQKPTLTGEPPTNSYCPTPPFES